MFISSTTSFSASFNLALRIGLAVFAKEGTALFLIALKKFQVDLVVDSFGLSTAGLAPFDISTASYKLSIVICVVSLERFWPFLSGGDGRGECSDTCGHLCMFVSIGGIGMKLFLLSSISLFAIEEHGIVFVFSGRSWKGDPSPSGKELQR